jgi:hypothetical protein
MKKIWVIIFVIIGISLLGGGVYAWKLKRLDKVISPRADGAITIPIPILQKLLTWDDPAGFTFQYPEGIEINKHDEDQIHYAHVELTEKNNKGSIIVWAKDTVAADSASWVKKEKNLAGGTIFDTTVGGMSGKKILIASPEKKIISGVVDEGIVFYIEGNVDGSEYWTKAYDTIATSFTFSSKKQADTISGGGEDTSAVDEEEVIE